MAAPSSASIIRVPGTIKWNGTELGTVRDKEFIPNFRARQIWAEEFGCVTDVIYGGEMCLFKAVSRYPDSAMIANMFPNASGTTWSFDVNSSVRAGKSLGSAAGVLLFTPRYSGHPSITLHNAIPALDEAFRLQLSLGEEYGTAMVWYGTPDTNGQVYTVA